MRTFWGYTEEIGKLEFVFTKHFNEMRARRFKEIPMKRIKECLLKLSPEIKHNGQYAIRMKGEKKTAYLIAKRQNFVDREEVVMVTITHNKRAGKTIKNKNHMKILEE